MNVPLILAPGVLRKSCRVCSLQFFYLLQSINMLPMGFLDKLRRKKDETVEKVKEQTTPQPYHPENVERPPGKKIKRYSSDGKPVYE
jgi:hypothetical protein